jgi:hypothetical protein
MSDIQLENEADQTEAVENSQPQMNEAELAVKDHIDTSVRMFITALEERVKSMGYQIKVKVDVYFDVLKAD